MNYHKIRILFLSTAYIKIRSVEESQPEEQRLHVKIRILLTNKFETF